MNEEQGSTMSTLTRYRVQTHLSRSKFADEAGVSRGVMQRAEEGHPIQDVNAQKIAETLSRLLNTSLSIEDLHIVLV